MDAARARDRTIARILLASATGLTLVYVLHTAAGVLPGGQWMELGVYHAALLLGAAACLLRGARGSTREPGWLLLGLAVLAWAVGDLYWQLVLFDFDPAPVPSLADAGYLALYPLAYAGVLLLMRRRAGGGSPSRWLDGIIAGLAVAAVAAALVVRAVTDAFGGDTLANVTNLAYPLGDGLLLALIVVSLALTGWRPGGRWLLVSAGLAVFAAADSAYLYLVATDTYHGGIVDCGWSVGILLIAWAAWQPEPAGTVGEHRGVRALAVPVAFGVVALAMLVYDHFARVSALSVLLATASVMAVMVRLGLANVENAQLLARTRVDALTDALTGLGNRRQLMLDLDAAVEAGTEYVVVLFDLDGFKAYNDTFGHPAGDALLVQLGRRLRAAAAPHAYAYRMGGDEFCLLIRAGDHEDAVIEAALTGLHLSGEAFSVDASWGRARLPGETATPSEALGLADSRMYARKAAGRPSAGRQSTDVLLRVLQERHPGLGDHLRGVAVLARAVGERVGLAASELDDVEFAAELHDVGKVAIPDPILHKPGPLDDEERDFMRRHTVIGERIVEAAPALTRAAALVRSSHERWDGLGYPDALAADQIPLGARVVAACDAFEAMTSDRPYRPARTPAAAAAELAAGAGTQFDPNVVAALLDHVGPAAVAAEAAASAATAEAAAAAMAGA
jgi:diguanylate cyclase (GGDEF)-like protein